MNTVRELIAKLQSLPEDVKDLPVMLQPDLDNSDAYDCGFHNYDIFNSTDDPLFDITMVTKVAQRSFPVSDKAKSKEYSSDEFDWASDFSSNYKPNEDYGLEERKVFILSSPCFKYGEEKDDVK